MEWKQMIGKREYMDKILSFLTERELAVFRRVFGGKINDVDGAIDLIERHMKSQARERFDIEQHNEEIKRRDTDIMVANDEKNHLKVRIISLEKDIERMQCHVEVIESETDTDSAYAKKRLAILDALEAGGVDNWEWYEESLKQANQ